MAKSHRIAENINIQQLAHILLLLISIQLCIYHYLSSLGEQYGEGRLPLNFPRMLTSSLLMRFSSSSRARAFRRSEINVVRPRMVDIFVSLEKRPVPPPPPPMLLRIVDAGFSLEYCKNRC